MTAPLTGGWELRFSIFNISHPCGVFAQVMLTLWSRLCRSWPSIDCWLWAWQAPKLISMLVSVANCVRRLGVTGHSSPCGDRKLKRFASTVFCNQSTWRNYRFFQAKPILTNRNTSSICFAMQVCRSHCVHWGKLRKITYHWMVVKCSSCRLLIYI